MGELTGQRVAILVQNLPVPFDRRVWQEATTLATAGASVTVICPDDGARYPAGDFNIEGIRVLRYANPPEGRGVGGYFREYLVALRRMRSALLRVRAEDGAFDAVHFCNPPDMLYLVARPLKRHDNTVLVFDQHDLGPELVKAKRLPLGFLFVAVARFFEWRTYRIADHVISTNQSYRQVAHERGHLAEANATVVRSAPSRNWPLMDFPRRDWHDGHRYLIGYLGVMGRQEGIEYLLESVSLLCERGLDVRLSLCGSGPERERLERLAHTMGLDDNVRFHGRVSDEELKSILTDADVCVNPDEVNEMNNASTMNKIIEYMALGRPIVQFDLREGRVSALEASLYAAANDVRDLADKIADVLSDPELAKKMGDFGRARFMEEICWEPQGETLVEVYVRLLEQSRTAVS